MQELTSEIKMPEYRLSIQAEEMDLRHFYMSLVEGTETNMVLSPKVEGKISFVAHQMLLEEILDLVYSQYGFSWEKTETGYSISDDHTETKSYNIAYLAISRSSNSVVSVNSSRIGSADSNKTEIATKHQSDILSELRSSLDHLIADDKLASYKINPTSGLLVLSAYPNTHKMVSKFLQKLNLNLHHQVLIEAKILEVELYDSYKQGIDWASIFKEDKFAAGQVGSGAIVSTPLDNYLGPATTDIVNLTNLTLAPTDEGFDKFLWDSFRSTQMGGLFKVGLFANNFKFVLDLLAGQGQVQVLSSPRITTLNNQKAIIRVGEEKKFVSEIQGGSSGSTTTDSNGVTTTSSGSEPSISFETYFSGISLVVMPHIINDGSLILHVHPAISSISEEKKTYTLNGNTYDFILPRNDIRESDSVIKVDNKQIVVLGGLMKSAEDKERAYIPAISQAPVLDHRVLKNRKSELVILIKPLIVTSASNEEIIQKQRETLQEFNNYLTFGK